MRKIIKQYLPAFLLTVIFLLSGCRNLSEYNETSPYSPLQIAEIIIASQENAPFLQPLPDEEDYFMYYYSNIYQLETDELEEGAIYYAKGTSVIEIAVLLLDDDADVEKTKNTLLNYIKQRIRAYTGYAPKETAILEKSVVITHGDYAALLICEDPQGAESDFLACFSDNPPDLPYITESFSNSADVEPSEEKEQTENHPDTLEEGMNNQNDIYDPAAILNAWNNGESSTLSYKNRIIFNICAEIISEVIVDGMDEFEKERAIHDWIIKWTDYDREIHNNAPDAKPDPNNDNPYGLLVNKRSICSGYSSTFQLFMDFLGIECITVNGTSGDSFLEHAWNMVHINGAWYCVDVTWDDPYDVDLTDDIMYKYFNVTSDFLWENNHHWDERSTPEANTIFDNTKYI